MDNSQILSVVEDLPVTQVAVTLRLTRPVAFHFFHGGAIHGLLCAAWQGHLPLVVFPFPCESGRVQFVEGDLYKIGVTFVGEGPESIDRLGSGLEALGRKANAIQGEPPVLGGNYLVDDLEVQQIELKNLSSVSQSATVRLLSPMRRERPHDLQVPGHNAMDAECFPCGHFLTGVWLRMGDLITALAPQLSWPECPPFPQGLKAGDANLVWLDSPVRGSDRRNKGRPQGFTLGGVVGSLGIEGLDPLWSRVLSLGRYFHVGQKIHFGLGRYETEEAWHPDDDFFAPASSAVEALVRDSVLRDALVYISSRSHAAGVDGLDPREAGQSGQSFFTDLAKGVQQGTYKPLPLLGIIGRKKNGRPRPLAIPAIADRCLQRAFTQVFGPGVDALLEDCSFAYRKGLSRQGAARAIEKAYAAGYRYVLESDIQSFFDHIDQKRIVAKFQSLFPYSGVEDILTTWVQAPVQYQGKLLERHHGLPQGAPISPMLANLFLDELDEELLGKNYRLVRFADDFVVLCKNLEAARKAKADAEAAVARLGLALNVGKTSITTFDQGFHFLGYLFLKSMVLDSAEIIPGAPGKDWDPLDRISSDAWLTGLDLDSPHKLSSANDREGLRKGVVPLEDVALEPDGRAECLYLFRPDQEVHLKGECLKVEGPGTESRLIPIREIAHLVSCGRTRLTVSILCALARRQIPVFMCHRTGELDVSFEHTVPNHKLWLAQGRIVDDEVRRVDFARSIIMAKLHNQATLVVRFKLGDHRKAGQKIRMMEKSCPKQGTVEGLMGLEGVGARVFFKALSEALHPSWGFGGRRKHPPPDPVNAMLSYGYTILYNHVSTALLAGGLNPRLGIMHRQRGAYHALACDIQEEFRFLVEAHVWSMIQKGMVSPEDFSPSDDQRYPCLMNRDLRHKFIMGLETRLAVEFSTKGSGSRVSYSEYLMNQARAVVDFVSGTEPSYRPFRLHA